MKDIIGAVKRRLNNSYEALCKLPRVDAYTMGGTYYGSTQLYSRAGNMIDLVKNQPYTSYGYGCNTNYRTSFYLRVGGACNSEQHKAIIKKFRQFIDEHRQEIFAAGWAIIDDYGTNFSCYGIARR